MKVMFVSQCTKNALIETRRILDQFAERKGDAVWETNITQIGLDKVKALLKSTARKNTAVACHLFRGRQQTELVWIVGNLRKFNLSGAVPTNISRRDILRQDDENCWHTAEAMSILVGIAGLFHDFGKANDLFQQKLRNDSEFPYEPFRHEWISLLLFKLFVGELSDEQWLQKLSNVSLEDEVPLVRDFNEKLSLEKKKGNHLANLPPVAKFVGWLILSHHRMPKSFNPKEEAPDWERAHKWVDDRKKDLSKWNSYFVDATANGDKWSQKEVESVGKLSHGTPILSTHWRRIASRFGKKAVRHYHLLKNDWFKDRFSMHVMRAALMLSDHLYSSDEANTNLQDQSYEVYANTSDGKDLKQRLDEHNIGVGRLASLIVKNLPRYRETLPSLFHKELKKSTRHPDYQWQNQSYDIAKSLSKQSYDHGFFGVNLASTGCGKTYGNARIMYGLSDEKIGCRFSVALGLRVLTLQTGDALQKKLSLGNDDIATLVGSQSFQELYQNSASGSDSAEDFFDGQQYVNYAGSLDDGHISKWLKKSPKLDKLVSAPILVSTIDHIMPLTEGLTGGRQIAPLLRLLTSDLVIDEPDDFDVDDLPALCRLVNFAGVFGARVLISSATLPPDMVKGLFESYRSGRKLFNKACRSQGVRDDVCCAWFDEFGSVSGCYEDSDTFSVSYDEFIKKRIAKLEKKKTLRRGTLVPVESSISSADESGLRQRALVHLERDSEEEFAKIYTPYAETIRKSIYDLHDTFCQSDKILGKNISFGIVRIAHINSMIKVAIRLLGNDCRPNYCIHYCVYHSQYPMLIRSKIESNLDEVLARHDLNAIWSKASVTQAIAKDDVVNHIFIVIANAVAEVGRDHDYDWAVVEPSSMRSIIQLAGRVQRHRKQPPDSPNVHILRKNINALKGKEIAFENPGFESSRFKIDSKDLQDNLLSSQYEKISSIPRLSKREGCDHLKNLVDLEHVRIRDVTFDSKDLPAASLWWGSDLHWCGEVQNHTPFRKSCYKDIEYFYDLEDESDTPVISIWGNEKKNICKVEDTYFSTYAFTTGERIHPWFDLDVKNEILKLADARSMPLQDVSIKFSTFRLRQLDDAKRWNYHTSLGFFEL